MYVKGADSVVEALLREPVSDEESERLRSTKEVVNSYAMIGLRTLYLGCRAITREFYDQWSQQYGVACRELIDRDQKME